MTDIIESNRTVIFDYLHKNPGQRAKAIAAAMDMPYNSISSVFSRDQRRGDNLFFVDVRNATKGRLSDVRYSVAKGAERPNDPPNYRAMSAARASATKRPQRQPNQNIALSTQKQDNVYWAPVDEKDAVAATSTRLKAKGYSTRVAHDTAFAIAGFKRYLDSLKRPAELPMEATE